MPCSRTQHGLTRVGLEHLTSGSGVRDINHQATVIDNLKTFVSDYHNDPKFSNK